MTLQYLDTPRSRRLAYVKSDASGPTIVFLGGYKSDMSGTKAVWLEDWCRARGQAYLRFDYSGHGQSSGAFEEGCIGDWAEDAEAVIKATCNGPLVLVGSSMGGWISLLLTQRLKNIVGLVTIAAAPDFTEDGRDHLVLRAPLPLPFPVRCLQGTADAAVTRDTALRLLDHADSPDMALTLLKGADHSFSAPDCLPLIAGAIEEVMQRADH